MQHLNLHMMAIFESRPRRVEMRRTKDFYVFALAKKSGGVEPWMSKTSVVSIDGQDVGMDLTRSARCFPITTRFSDMALQRTGV